MGARETEQISQLRSTFESASQVAESINNAWPYLERISAGRELSTHCRSEFDLDLRAFICMISSSVWERHKEATLEEFDSLSKDLFEKHGLITYYDFEHIDNRNTLTLSVNRFGSFADPIVISFINDSDNPTLVCSVYIDKEIKNKLELHQDCIEEGIKSTWVL